MTQRVYRDDLRCPHCGSNRTPKDGHSRGKQTPCQVRGRLYRCDQCRYRFTPDGNRSYYAEAVKTQAVRMYVEGVSVSVISRTLRVKGGTVYSWLKKARTARTVLRDARKRRSQGRRSQRQRVKVISFDEMWTYVGSRRRGKRRSRWIWTAVVEEADGRRWSDFAVGLPKADGERTFLRLYGRLPDAELYRRAVKPADWRDRQLSRNIERFCAKAAGGWRRGS